MSVYPCCPTQFQEQSQHLANPSWFPLRPLSLQMAVFSSPSFHMVSPLCCLCPIPSSYQNTSQIGLQPTLRTSLQLDYQPARASVNLGQRGHHHAKTMPTYVLGHAVQVHRSYLVTRSLDSLASPPPSPHHHPCLKPGVCGSLRDLLSFPDPHSPVLTPHMLRNLPSAPFSPQVPHSPWKLGRFQADTGRNFGLLEKRGSVISHFPCPVRALWPARASSGHHLTPS